MAATSNKVGPTMAFESTKLFMVVDQNTNQHISWRLHINNWQHDHIMDFPLFLVILVHDRHPFKPSLVLREGFWLCSKIGRECVNLITIVSNRKGIFFMIEEFGDNIVTICTFLQVTRAKEEILVYLIENGESFRGGIGPRFRQIDGSS